MDWPRTGRYPPPLVKGASQEDAGQVGPPHPQPRVLLSPARPIDAPVDLLVSGPVRGRISRWIPAIVLGLLLIGTALMRTGAPDAAGIVFRPGASIIVHDVEWSGRQVDVQLHVELRNDGPDQLEVLGARLDPPTWQVTMVDRPTVVSGEAISLQLARRMRCDLPPGRAPDALLVTVRPKGGRPRTDRLSLRAGERGPALAGALLGVPAQACQTSSPARQLWLEHLAVVAR